MAVMEDDDDDGGDGGDGGDGRATSYLGQDGVWQAE